MKSLYKLLSLSILTTLSSYSSAAITGQVEVKLNVSTGCSVNNSQASAEGNMNKFGTLDFGKTATAWSNVLTSELQSASDKGKLTVKCDGKENVPFQVSIDGGLRGDRTLKNTASIDTLPYTIYKDSARTQAYVINTPQSFQAVPEKDTEIPIYGAIAANNKAIEAGDYSDTLLVNITF